MKNKLKVALTILLSCALTCILTIRIVTGQNPFTVLAAGGDDWVYSVNNVSADANGNVGVTTVNSKTMNSSVPANADFEQYEANTTDLDNINAALSNLTATAINVDFGKSAVTAGGEKQNGLNRNLFARYDFNLDGNLNSADSELISDCITESITFESVQKRFDLNSDGSVDITDMSILSGVIANYNGLEDPLGMTGYDIDGDGIINNDDYTALQAMVMGGTGAKVLQYLCASGKLFDMDGSGSVTVSDIIDLRDKLPAIKAQREALVGITNGVNTAAYNVLSGRTFYGTNGYETGTMPNNGAISETVGIGGSYTIPRGYHSGTGTVTGPTLIGDATPEDVASGKTFYSNSGTLQTGTLNVSGLRQLYSARTTLGRSNVWSYTMPNDGYLIGVAWGAGASSQDNALHVNLNGSRIYDLSAGYSGQNATYIFRALKKGDVIQAWCPSDNYWAGINWGFYTLDPA